MVQQHHITNRPSGHRLIEVERSTGGLVVTFEDGRTAVFDPDWMYDQIPQARLVVEPDERDSDQLPC